MTRWLVAFAFAFVLSPASRAQLPPQKALATMKPAEGFQVELFAAEPMLLNPTSIDVDHKGRVWVAEAVNYRRKNFGRPMLRPAGDRIVVLVDKDADGKADESVVFYQGPEIYGPLSVCVIPQASGGRKSAVPGNQQPADAGRSPEAALRVLVAQSPDILEFWDRDGDLKADGPPKKFLSGFNGFDHDHGVHGLNIGPDGKLYFTVGDAGVKNLKAADGKGPTFSSNATDCRAGTVWRCDLDGTNVELIAHNFRNNYECCVDSFGEIWLSDNDDDGNQQTRICFVMPGGNYGYHPRGPGQTHWHEEQPGIVHKTLRTGFGSPTGITFYEGTLFPKKYAGAILHCDAGPREVRAFFRKPKGAGYELDKEVILTSTDNFFRPSDVCVAPDGSIFVADWYDRGVGGHGMGDPTDGRIYRLTPKGHKGYTVPAVKLDTKEGVWAAMTSANIATRQLAHEKIKTYENDQANDWFNSGGKRPVMETIRAQWIVPPFYAKANKEPAENYPLEVLLRKTPAVLPFQILKQLGGRMADSVMGPRNDYRPPANSPPDEELVNVAICREYMLLLRRVASDVPNEVVANYFFKLAKAYPGHDHFYLAALNIACGTDPKRRDAILADFDKHFPEWNDKVADLVWELRPKSVLPRLEKLLGDAKLTGPQKARIIDILAASDDAAAGRTMLAVLKSNAPAEVKARAIDQLRQFLPGKWKGLQRSPDLAAAIDGLLADPKSKVTGVQLVAAAAAVNRIDAVVGVAADADVPVEVRKEAIRALGKLKAPRSVEALLAFATAPSPAPRPPLAVEAINALASLITTQPKDSVGRKAQDALEGLVLSPDVSADLKKVAVSALAGTMPGSQWLIAIKERGGLPKVLEAEVGRLLRNSAFQPIRNKALLVFPAPGKLNIKKLPAVAELAKRAGNVERGKKVWADSFAGAAQCAKCHTVRGVGGQVGPDLSMIGKKASKENLFESVLDPSKAIADQYVQHSVTTAAGVTVSGLLVSDTPQGITLRDANGKDTIIPRADIDGEIRKLKTSIMPQDIVGGLNEDELIDLVAYLQTLQTAAVTPDSFWVVGPFVGKSMKDALDTEYGPEKEAFDPKAMFPSFRRSSIVLGWKSMRPDAKGYFDLAALHGEAGNNAAAYLQVTIDSPVDQDAEILLGTDDGAKMWINGKEVFKFEGTRAAAPGQDTVKVKLKKGKNAVLLKVANGTGPHGFYFTLLSKDEVKAVSLK